MPVSQFARPAACLEPFVRFYVQRGVRILGATVIHPVPARPAPMVVFDFNDPTDVLYYAKRSVTRSPSAVLVGPQTYRRLEMQLRGALDTFVIGFQPNGIFRLFAVPTSELTDFDFEAHSVLGSVITKLGERLGNCASFEERVRIVEDALIPRALQSSRPDGISAAVQRKFLQQVGTRPEFLHESPGSRLLLSTKLVPAKDYGQKSLIGSLTTTRCIWCTTLLNSPALPPRRH